MKKNFTKLFVVLFALVSLTANAAGSGIFIRGGMNGWGADPAWEFVDKGEGVYTLENKEMMGAFKVADATWSDNCNYGSSGSAIKANENYNLTLKANDNINVEGTIQCELITLTIKDGVATLNLKGAGSVDDEINQLYVIGDNNTWNFNDKSGILLPVDGDKKQFEGIVTFPAGAAELAYWRIYENIGQVGSWGLEANATEHTAAGILMKGKEGCVTVTPNTYKITFDLEDGTFSATILQGVENVDTEQCKVMTSNGIITVTGEPTKVEVYSASGALISANKNSVEVQSGIYIVVVDNKATKIAVK